MTGINAMGLSTGIWGGRFITLGEPYVFLAFALRKVDAQLLCYRPIPRQEMLVARPWYVIRQPGISVPSSDALLEMLQTQGANHLERGRNFEALLNSLGFPKDAQTVDYVQGVDHNGFTMLASKEGIDKVRANSSRCFSATIH